MWHNCALVYDILAGKSHVENINIKLWQWYICSIHFTWTVEKPSQRHCEGNATDLLMPPCFCIPPPFLYFLQTTIPYWELKLCTGYLISIYQVWRLHSTKSDKMIMYREREKGEQLAIIYFKSAFAARRKTLKNLGQNNQCHCWGSWLHCDKAHLLNSVMVSQRIHLIIINPLAWRAFWSVSWLHLTSNFSSLYAHRFMFCYPLIYISLHQALLC
jgi:hypothetical protein